MDADEMKDAIRRILRYELDDCERAIKKEDLKKAKRELENAITKLKRIANS